MDGRDAGPKKRKGENGEEVCNYESLVAKNFQLEIFEIAKEKNVIAHLTTGSGKTYIAILLLKSRASFFRNSSVKKIAIFLVPSVPLAEQQKKAIAEHTDFSVKDLVGSKMDSLDSLRWEKEIAANEVLVMTPQVLFNALSHSFVKLEMVDLLIFDECHHAQSDHPYAVIMREFYHKMEVNMRPKIFGMTASPVISKGVKSTEDCKKLLQLLEQTLDAELVAVKTDSEKCQEDTVQFEPHVFSDTSKDALVFLEDLKEALIRSFSHDVDSKDPADQQTAISQRKRCIKRVANMYNSLVYCVMDLGLYCAFQAAKMLYNDAETGNAEQHEKNESMQQILLDSRLTFLQQALRSLECKLPAVEEKMGSDKFSRESAIRKQLRVAISQDLLTPKVELLLLELLRNRNAAQGDEFHCIVFAERVVAVNVLNMLLSEVAGDFIKCLDITGGQHQSPTQQDKALRAFRNGEINVLVATGVAEEGLDIQSCNVVIRFDLCKTVRSYLQGKGRARKKNSRHIIFVEGESPDDAKAFMELQQSDSLIWKEALGGNARIPMEADHHLPNVEEYKVASTGAVANIHSSINLVQHYCSLLPGDRYCNTQPRFVTEMLPEGYVVHVRLPLSAPLDAQNVRGPLRLSKLRAKQVACLEVIKILHRLNGMTDALLPNTGNEDPRLTGGASFKTLGGSSNKREKVKPVVPQVFQGFPDGLRSATNAGDPVNLFMYSISFTASGGRPGSSCWSTADLSTLGLFLEKELDPEASSLAVNLTLVHGGTAVARLAKCGRVTLNRQQVMCAKAFQMELFSEGLWRCTRCLNCTGNQIHDLLWNQEKIYLILPLTSIEPASGAKTEINWKVVENAVERWSLAQGHAFVESLAGENPCVRILTDNGWESKIETGTLVTACGPVKVDDLIGKVVSGIHNGWQYYVQGVRQDLTAESSFPVDTYNSYEEFFKKWHKWQLRYPKQPLLSVRQVNKARNSLALNSATENSEAAEKPMSENRFVELPPELCRVVVPGPYFRSTQLLPSVMHRVEMLQGACELRDLIALEMGDPRLKAVRGNKVMEALTSSECQEEFSLERHELLGDTCLKYGVTCHLVREHPEEHEGLLTLKRSREICNSNLYERAMRKGLQRHLRATLFTIGEWQAPGLPPVPYKCPHYPRGRSGLVLGEERAQAKGQKNTTSCVIEEGGEKQVKSEIQKEKEDEGHSVSMKSIADMVEGLIGVFWTELNHNMGPQGGFLMMEWLGIAVKNAGYTSNKNVEERGIGFNLENGKMKDGSLLRYKKLEMQIGYEFHNKELLQESMTHASYSDSTFSSRRCYQRLEFLGDAFLDFAVTQHLEKSYPWVSAGQLTDLRSAVVNNEKFARVAIKDELQLHNYVDYHSEELRRHIGRFVTECLKQQTENDVICDHDYGSGEETAPKVLGDLFEALAGAMLVDSFFDYESVWKHLRPLLEPFPNPETVRVHPKRELLELCQMRKWTLDFQVDTVLGLHKTTALVNGVAIASGEHSQKEAGMRIVASLALSKIKEEEKLEFSGKGTSNKKTKKKNTTGLLECGMFKPLKSSVGASGNLSETSEDQVIGEASLACGPTRNGAYVTEIPSAPPPPPPPPPIPVPVSLSLPVQLHPVHPLPHSSPDPLSISPFPSRPLPPPPSLPLPPSSSPSPTSLTRSPSLPLSRPLPPSSRPFPLPYSRPLPGAPEVATLPTEVPRPPPRPSLPPPCPLPISHSTLHPLAHAEVPVPLPKEESRPSLCSSLPPPLPSCAPVEVSPPPFNSPERLPSHIYKDIMLMEAENCKSWTFLSEVPQLAGKHFLHGAQTLTSEQNGTVYSNGTVTEYFTQNPEEIKGQESVDSVRSQPEKKLSETDYAPSRIDVSSNLRMARLATGLLSRGERKQVGESGSSLLFAKSGEAGVHAIVESMPGAKMLEQELEPELLQAGRATSILLELCQKHLWNFCIEDRDQTGPSHAPSFTLEVKLVTLSNEIVESAFGTAKKKKEAKNLAAIEILKKLRIRKVSF